MSNLVVYKMVFCHDVGGCHAHCNYKGVAPMLRGQELLLVKTCMCASGDCKYQLALDHIPRTPVYFVQTSPANTIEAAATNRQHDKGMK